MHASYMVILCILIVCWLFVCSFDWLLHFVSADATLLAKLTKEEFFLDFVMIMMWWWRWPLMTMKETMMWWQVSYYQYKRNSKNVHDGLLSRTLVIISCHYLHNKFNGSVVSMLFSKMTILLNSTLYWIFCADAYIILCLHARIFISTIIDFWLMGLFMLLFYQRPSV